MVKENLQRTVYDYLFSQICEGHILPNAPLVEQDISNQLAISRTPVREALQALERDGLVDRIAHRGTFVKELTLKDINEIYELRKLLELESLKSAIETLTAEELDQMEERVTSVVEGSALDSFYNADRAFHTMIVQHSYNSRMLAFYNMLSAQVERIRRLSSATPKRLVRSRTEHIEIVQALQRRDLKLAQERLSLHLKNVQQSSINVMESLRTGLI